MTKYTDEQIEALISRYLNSSAACGYEHKHVATVLRYLRLERIEMVRRLDLVILAARSLIDNSEEYESADGYARLCEDRYWNDLEDALDYEPGRIYGDDNP